MDQQIAQSLLSLFAKLERMIDVYTAKVDELDRRIEAVSARQKPTYSQVEVADMTGWSNSTISNLVKQGKIEVVPGTGRLARIPASEVDRLIALKGEGRRAKQDRR